jgi:hypothetical protein
MMRNYFDLVFVAIVAVLFLYNGLTKQNFASLACALLSAIFGLLLVAFKFITAEKKTKVIKA